MNNGGNFISSIVSQMGNGKKGILTDEASTIVEKFKHPAITSRSMVKRAKSYASATAEAGRTVKSVDYEKESGADKSALFSKFPKNAIIASAVESYNREDSDKVGGYKAPKAPAASDKSIKMEEGDEEEYGEEEYVSLEGDLGCPEIFVDDSQMPGLVGYLSGDEIEIEFKAVIASYVYSEDNEGNINRTYGIKLKEAKVEPYAMED